MASAEHPQVSVRIRQPGQARLRGRYRDNVKSSDMLDAVWKRLKKKTLGVIRQLVDIILYNHVAKDTYPHTFWKNLENMYETKNAQAKCDALTRHPVSRKGVTILRTINLLTYIILNNYKKIKK